MFIALLLFFFILSLGQLCRQASNRVLAWDLSVKLYGPEMDCIGCGINGNLSGAISQGETVAE